MVGIYFSGTGNSKYCVETFLRRCAPDAHAFSIEDPAAVQEIQLHKNLVIGFPVQYSSIPKILRDFVDDNHTLWRGKHIFVIATMGLFSGDGAGVLARLLHRYGAAVTGGLHLKMPDSICDERLLKRSPEDNRKLIQAAERKTAQAAADLAAGNPPQDGLGPLCRFVGLFGQRLYFRKKTEGYSDKLHIDLDKCIGCGQCVELCPMGNLSLGTEESCAKSGTQCTMCYRCISRCPAQAITLLGKRVVEQYQIDNYL